jgi:putative transcriptional regulator
MYSTKTDVQSGKILVSEPFLLDSYFKRSVILLTQHTEEGSIGFIINKPTDLKVNDALDEFPYIDAPLYFGGPIQTDTIHFIHKFKHLVGALELLPGIYWGGDLEQLKSGISQGRVAQEDIRFYAGIAGWDPDQLQEEMKSKMWLMTNKQQKNFIFSEKPEDLWGEVLRSMGSQYAVLANFPEDPSLN